MFNWLKNYKLYGIRSAGLHVMIDCMDVQKRHLEFIIEGHKDDPKYHDLVVSAKGKLDILNYWQEEARRVYDGKYL